MTPDRTRADLVEIHLLEVPIPLWSRSQQQTDELLREFALAAAAGSETHHLPARLTELIESLNAEFGGVSTEQEEQLFAAAHEGLPVIKDLEFAMPSGVGPACVILGDMLDEADEYCRQGQHLLTLAASDDVVQFRRWYLSQFVRQLAGDAPQKWDDYDGYWPTAT